MERSGGLAFSARGPRGDRSSTVGGRERASTDRHLHGVHVLPPRARTVDRPRRVPIDTNDGERNVGWKEGGERPMSAPRQAFSTTVDRPVAAVSSQLLISRPSCDDGLICVN